MWKTSQYNVITNFNDKLSVHNLLSHKGFLLIKEQEDTLIKIFEAPNDYTSVKSFEYLCQNGFIVEEDTNEIRMVDELKYTLIQMKSKLLQLTIIPTHQCNFKCIYCWENTKNTDDRMLNDIQQKLLSLIEDKMDHFSALSIDWFGGEPLIAYLVMANLLTHIDEICKRKKKPYTCSLTTNGYGLTLDRVRFLVNHHTHFFQVTLDGPSALHNKNRPLKNGGETFEVILNNLIRMKREIKEKTFKCLIRLNMTAETHMFFDEFITLIQNEFADDNRFSVYIQGVETHNFIRSEEMEGKYLHNYAEVEECYDLCIARNIKTAALKMLEPGALMCKTIYEGSFFVSPDGSMYKCDMDMNPDHVSYMGSLVDGVNIELTEHGDDFWKNVMIKNEYCNSCLLLPLCCGLKCPYYNTLNPNNQCELYNNVSIVRNAMKTYAQENRYPLIVIE